MSHRVGVTVEFGRDGECRVWIERQHIGRSVSTMRVGMYRRVTVASRDRVARMVERWRVYPRYDGWRAVLD